MTRRIAGLGLLATLVATQPAQAVTQMAGVSGQVIEEGTNTPVAGARLFVVVDDERAAPVDPPPSALTDQAGRYHFDALPAGRYRIAAQQEGFAPPIDPSTMQLFEVAAGQVLDGVTVTLQRGGVIAGRVLDPLGQPLAGVAVTALLKRLNSPDRPTGQTWDGAALLMPSGQSQTSGAGAFRILGLWPGEYVIMANMPPQFGRPSTSSFATTTVTSTFFPGTADLAAAEPVKVQSGETIGDLTIQLVTVASFQVSGVVVDKTGAPVEGAMVMLMDAPHGTDSFLSLMMGPRGMSQSDERGRFTLRDVPAGSYTLRAGGFSGIGAFEVSATFGIDSDGTPRSAPNRPTPAVEPGTIELTVENADISDLKIVVPESQ